MTIKMLFVLVLLTPGSWVWAANTAEGEEPLSSKKPDVCEVARAPMMKAFKMSAPLERAVNAYKAEWMAVCQAKGGRSMAPLWEKAPVLAKRVNEEFGKQFSDAFSRDSLDRSPDKAIGLVDKLRKALPGMVVGFVGESEGSDSDWPAFLDNAYLGDQADRFFFGTLKTIYGDRAGVIRVPPWIKQTWDYGGCTTYGSYNWVATLKMFEESLNKSLPKTYLDVVRQEESRIFDMFVNDTGIGECACDKAAKDAFLSDLKAVKDYADQSRHHRKYSARLAKRLNDARTQKIKIRQDDIAPCAG